MRSPGRGRRACRAFVLAVAALTTAGCGVVELSTGPAAPLVTEPQTSLLIDATGDVVAELHGEEDREDVRLDEVAPVLRDAIVAVEDRRFWEHAGVDVPSMGRALLANVEAGDVAQGGSTITQQYVKNTITGAEVTAQRKVEEAALALQLERELTKEQILERYLNTVYFGAGAHGVAAAARTYYDVEPDQLDLDQAALLAGLVRQPSRLDPFDHPDAALARREVVLDAMVREGLVERAVADEAAAAPLELRDRARAVTDLDGWFLDEVRRRIVSDDRFAMLGDTPDQRETALLSGGLRVETTLDPAVQRAAVTAVDEQLAEEGDPSGAAVVIDPASGAVRALVGGRSDQYVPGGFSLATQGRRQPGSAFKAIVLAAALERGVALDRGFPGGTCRAFPAVDGWEEGVCNYARSDPGPVTLREATVRSVNTVYAELGVELGPRAMAEQAQALGVTSELPAVHSLALGTGEVSPLDMAAAYAPLATGGVRHPVHLVRRITDADGTELYAHDATTTQVIDPLTAHQVTATLEEVVARGTGVRAAIDRPQAGKTGTSQDSADAWFVGYTPDLVASVWVGFPRERTPMVPPATRELVEGGRWPAQIWARLAQDALAATPPTPFAEPATGVVTIEVDVTRDCLPNPYTPADVVEERDYPAGEEPTDVCTEPTGPPVDGVPDLEGLPLEVALGVLDDGGFRVEQRPIAPQLYPTGFVERQRPAPGGTTSAADDGAVVVWVGTVTRGAVEVPDVRGLRATEAVQALEAAGFVVDVRRGCPAAPCSPLDAVVEQSPTPGTRGRRHGVVELLVTPDDETEAAAAEAALAPTDEPTR